MQRKIKLVAGAVLGILIVLSNSKVAHAAYDSANLIEDHIFTNTGTMNAGDIQNFLNNRGGGLRNFSEGGRSAAQIIYDYSQAYGINPQVVIATLQKEQPLITDPNPDSTQYNSAMGYGCPSSCNPAYAGFTNQVDNGTWQLRLNFERARGNQAWWNSNINYACSNASSLYSDGLYPGRTVTFYNPGGSARTIVIANAATASLYCYTPHVGPFSETGYSGSYNFVINFEAWFGPVHGGGFLKVKASDCSSACPQYVVYGSIKQHIPNSDIINAWGLTDDRIPLTDIDPNTLNGYTTGPNLDRLMRINTNSGVLYFLDGGKRYVVHNQETVNAWNLGGMVTSYVSPGLGFVPTEGGSLTYSVKNPSNSTLYMVDGINGSGQRVLRPYQSGNNDRVFKAWEGDGATYVNISSDFFATMDDAIGSTLSNTKIAYGGAEYQAVGGYRMEQSISYAALFPGVATSVSATTFNRLLPTAPVSYLIKSKTSPSVYLLDNGEKHHVQDPNFLTAWSTPVAGYHTLEDAYVDLIPTGTPINGYMADFGGQLYVIDKYKFTVPSNLDGAYRSAGTVISTSSTLIQLFGNASDQASSFIKGRDTAAVYLVDNSGRRRQFENSDKLLLWGENFGVTVYGDYFINSLATNSAPSIFVSNGTNEYVMENGKKVGVSAGAKAEWGLSSPQVYSDGTLDRFSDGGTLDTRVRHSGNYYLIRDGAAYHTTDPNLADVWNIDDAPSRRTQLVTSLLPVHALTKFVRSSTDDRIFLIDDANWYNLGNANTGPSRNLAADSESVMVLDPVNAPAAITDWTAFIVKDPGGNYYVIDSGGKRSFPHQMILDHWTAHGTLTVPTVNFGFVNLLPYRGIVERVVKGSAPMVYSAENGTKRHILYPDTYNRYYAPYGIVGDRLLDTIPNGSPI